MSINTDHLAVCASSPTIRFHLPRSFLNSRLNRINLRVVHLPGMQHHPSKLLCSKNQPCIKPQKYSSPTDPHIKLIIQYFTIGCLDSWTTHSWSQALHCTRAAPDYQHWKIGIPSTVYRFEISEALSALGIHVEPIHALLNVASVTAPRTLQT